MTAFVVTAVASAFIGGIAVWALQQRVINALEQENALLTDKATSAAELQAELDRRELRIAELADRVDDLLSMNDLGASETKTPQEIEAARQFAFITGLTAGDPGSVTADFAQFLTGDEAAAAAELAGEESPPPNDFFVVNTNDRLRTLPVTSDADVRLVTRPGEGSDVEGYSADVDQLAGYLAQDTEDTVSLRVNGYWLTIENGSVVAIEEQYTP